MTTVQMELEFPTRQKMGDKSNDEATKAILGELKKNVDRTGMAGNWQGEGHISTIKLFPCALK